MTRTLALVESPSQLLNVLEWSHQAAPDGGVHVAVLLPEDPFSRHQLAATAALARSAGLSVEACELRQGPQQWAREAGALVMNLLRADRLVIGDPFSGLIQTMLPLSRARRVVVVDDGTATIRFADCVRTGHPLVRWRHDGPVPPRAVRAGRRLAPRGGRDLCVFTSIAGVLVPGADRRSNTYTWTRQRSRPEIVSGQVDVIGVSLVETGVVAREAYVGALETISRRHPSVRYLAHRREDPGKLAEIAVRTGARIVRPDLPVELALRAGPVAARVITFPSTPAHTLPVVLADCAVVIELQPIEPRWFAATCGPHARAFVQRVGDESARRPAHGGRR